MVCHYWSIAMSMICHQRPSVWLLVFLHAQWIPMLADCTAALFLLSQVAYQRLRGLLQLSSGQNNVLVTSWWSCLESTCAKCLKKWSCFNWVREETNSLLDSGTGYMSGIVQRMLRNDHVSKASSCLAEVFVKVQASDPYISTGST